MEQLNTQNAQPQSAPADQNLFEVAESLTPEQMTLFKQSYQRAHQILSSEGVRDSVLAEVNQDKVEGLASVTVQVIMKAQQGNPDFQILLMLGIVLITDIAEVLSEALGVQFKSGEIEEAIQVAVQMWLVANKGQYDENRLQQLMQSVRI